MEAMKLGTFFEFCHLVYRSNPDLLVMDSDPLEKIMKLASERFAEDLIAGHVQSLEEWIECRFGYWMRHHVYVSDSMPEKCKEIVQSQKHA